MEITLTLAFTAITVVISILSFSNEHLKYSLAMIPTEVNAHHQYYRFLTSGFVHADWMHLIFNMFTFYSFGNALEYIFGEIFGETGKIYFGVLYILGIIISDIPSFFKHKKNSNYVSLGASGGVSAIIFASILFFPTGTLRIYFIPVPAIIFAVLYIFYSVYQMRNGNDNINHSAHLWGAIFGVAFVLFAYPYAANIFWTQLTNWHIFNR